MTRRECPAELDVAVGIAHDVAVEVLDAGRSLDDVLELLGGDRVTQVRVDRERILEPVEIVEPVTIHQPFHLIFEDGVEGGAELPREDVNLGESSDPQIDGIESIRARRKFGDLFHPRQCCRRSSR